MLRMTFHRFHLSQLLCSTPEVPNLKFPCLTRFKLFLNASHLKVGPVDHVEYEEEKWGEKEEESVHVVVSENIKLFFSCPGQLNR